MVHSWVLPREVGRGIRIVTREHSSISVTKLNWHNLLVQRYLMYRQILRSEVNNMKNNPLRRIYIIDYELRIGR